MASKKSVSKRSMRDYESCQGHGWIKLDRSILHHPIFGDSPLSEREAFIWMICEATHRFEGRQIVVFGEQYLLLRGQLSHAYRFLADVWGWSRSHVERFLKKLINARMVETNIETGQILITLCNYEKFQGSRVASETSSETELSQLQNDEGTNKKKGKNLDKDKTSARTLAERGLSVVPAVLASKGHPWQERVRGMLSEPEYRSWISKLTLKEDGYVYCSNRHARDYCSNNFTKTIRDALLAEKIAFKGFRVTDEGKQMLS
jgi:hypothetical protein